MYNLKAAYINELFKISKKKKIVVASLLSIALVATVAVILGVVNGFTGVGMLFTGNFAIYILPIFEYTIIPLFTAFIAIDMFSGEYSNDTIKLTLTRPVSRFKVYLSKVLACATFLGIFLGFTMVIAIIISMFGDFSVSGLLKTTLSYLATFFPLMVFALMVMLISNFSRGSASAFLISIVVFLLFKGLEIAFPSYSSFIYTSSFDWYKLFVGHYINWGKIFRLLLIFAGTGTVFFASGYLLFDRREI